MKVPKFKLTDGRAWYKQVVTGILLPIGYVAFAMMYLLFIGIALLGAVMVYLFIDHFGMLMFLQSLGLIIVAIAAIFAVAGIYLWSTDELD